MMAREAFIAGVVAGTIVKTKGGLCPLCGYPKSPAQRTMVCGGEACRNVAYEAGYQKMLMDRKGDAQPRKVREERNACEAAQATAARDASQEAVRAADLTPFMASCDHGQYVYCADPITGF